MKCLTCSEENEQNFYLRKNGRSFSYCKKCTGVRNKENRLKNIDSRRAKDRKNYHKNRDTNKESAKLRRIKNRDARLEYCKNYYKKNKRRILDQVNNWQKQKEINDPNFRLKKSISRSILKVLKNNEESTWKTFLPFTWEELKQHLEKNFESWMNWSNHGIYNKKTWNDYDPSTWTWQIDHIIPHSKFGYTNVKDNNFIRCWNLNNLRPLSSKQNVIDGNRR